MRYIEVEQELHESSQPRRGKGVQTDTDLARTEYFRARTVTTGFCLHFVGQIAENVKRWATGEAEVKDVGRGKEKEKKVDFGIRDQDLIDFNENIPLSPDDCFKPVWEDEDDEPYINPMTGQWITPVTSKSAGPSNSQWMYENPSRKASAGQVLKADESLFPTTDEVREANIPNILVDLQRRVQPKDVSVVPQLPPLSIFPKLIDLDDDDQLPYDALLPGAILPPTNPFSNPLPSRRSSTNTSGSNTPNTSSRDTDHEPEDIFLDSANGRQQIVNLQSECALDNDHLQNTLQFAFPLEDATTTSRFDLDRLAALKLQAQFDNEAQQTSHFRSQDGYAGQLEQEERTGVLGFSADTEAAKRLALEWEAQDGIYEQNLEKLRKEWAEEDRRLEEQAAFADAMRRDEEARDEAIRRDQAAAMAALNQWEQERREAEDSTRRLREQIEREEEEEMERMRAAIEQARRLAEELERQEEEERQRLAAEAAEAERRERQADCVVCMEPSDKVDMCSLSCEHYYCEDCVIAAFNTALSSRAPFTCCTRDPIPASVATDFLPAQTVIQYDLMVLELTTPNPRYCSNRNCRLFIPPNSVHGPLAICPSCHTRTCSLCNNAEHAGVCAEDREGAAVVAMARGMGWKPCPRCGALVEKHGGCLHMTCKISSCRAQWCWECLRDWGICNSTCRRA